MLPCPFPPFFFHALQEASKVESQMKLIARPMYSNPPLHGALLVSKILHDADLKQQWYQVRYN